MHYVIVDGNDAVVHGPAGWSAFSFGLKLRGLLEAAGAQVGSVALGIGAPTAALAWEGVPFRILPCVVVGDYDSETQVLGAPVVAGDAATASAVDKPLAEVQAKRIAEAKAEAGRLILGRYPLWRQSNMQMRAIELHDKRLTPSALTEAEEAEAAALRSAADWIKAIRADSNAIEAWIMAEGRTVADLRSMAGAPGWTE